MYIGAKMINYLEVLVQFKSLLYIIIHYYYIHIIIHIIHYKKYASQHQNGNVVGYSRDDMTF